MTVSEDQEPAAYFGPIGASLPRIEDLPLLTGKGRYLDDIRMPGVRHVAVVRSGMAHAVLRAVETRAAAGVPGVQAVFTIADLMPMLRSARMPLGAMGAGKQGTNTPFVLARDEVAYVGEPIALVVAESRYCAEDAAALIEVEYEALEAVHDARSAILPGSPCARRELSSNVLDTMKVGISTRPDHAM